ncbi:MULTISPECIES: ParB/RepB/Spo0J family partition protein [unclassified Sphingobium]|uniref:ParB/RepB/Spo0J family partition protein n=1 Tax=unclassified Sphingobium TaxID=2611147 RepID=UPI000D1610A1|nr:MULTISPECIES: ParB/RepB/Spo0J family partition protein [unclassified Sphingobium]MBG6120153.1 ParB family chromosome partitioning protein [Sphingobium sp. JAI105]PSO12810.1 chromosome partitioning protein ParB [Sphingobium sp. AEW4]TWD05646.1 ParB family chromosome partitioning protein [Sphingobium sp. AEW010]TWD23199.1 ParB family chromosome partitioning protein [Sphingobium sp. AEW013]TWD25059.1 ParB family chromosome partitioning protein [Sphingobium sp. AEW001]
MARKQSDYLASLLADEPADAPAATIAASTPSNSISASPAPPRAPAASASDAPPTERPRASTLLGRESALARVASGEVRQVTQLLLDPARVRIWPGNARAYAHLSEENCRELIDSIIAEGGQKVPAVIRRVEGDAAHDYEVIAGTRRHWSISWLRSHSYPEMMFIAQVAVLDDEAAFRLADLENRARKDVSDLERARNYAAALTDHYGNHLTRMAERLKLSKGWLSKMIKVAGISDTIFAAFASPADVQLKPAYALAQALDDDRSAPAIAAEAKRIAAEQRAARAGETLALPAAEVLRRLLNAPRANARDIAPAPFIWSMPNGRPGLSIQSVNRQGVTVRIHAGSGADIGLLTNALREALEHLERQGLGLQK